MLTWEDIDIFRKIWARGEETPLPGALSQMTIQEQAARLRHATSGLESAMNDDILRAEAIFQAHDDCFHDTGKVLLAFFEAALAFDKKEIIACAALLDRTLARLENELSCSKPDTESKLPAGSEFSCCIATVLLQLTITGFMSGSIGDAMKAVFRLKRAYRISQTLYNHMLEVHVNMTMCAAVTYRTLGDKSAEVLLGESQAGKPLARDGSIDAKLSEKDMCIASAATTGYGLLSLMISLIPASVSRILSIVGFHNDKEESLALLRDAVNAPNLQGAITLLALLTYYGGILALADISEDTAPNLKRLSSYLVAVRCRYPQGAIWRLQEAKLEQLQGNVTSCIGSLEALKITPQMKQIEVLRVYELGVSYLLTFQWQKAADQFTIVEQLNDWSRSQYHFIIGACHLELYFATKVDMHTEKAERHLVRAAKECKRKIMGREVPLEVYVKHKVAKWQSRSLGNPLIDGISMSPIFEYFHLFNFWTHMQNDTRGQCLRLLSRQDSMPDSFDDQLSRQLVTCAIKRNMQDWTCFEIINHCSTVMKSAYKAIPYTETWAIPYAQYEHAVCYWNRDGIKSRSDIRHWLEKATSFGESEHGQRLAIRLNTATDTLNRAEVDK